MEDPKKTVKRTKRVPKSMFTPEDDMRLLHLAITAGIRNWMWISQQMVNKTPRQCRERWQHYVDPSLYQGEWTPEEDQLLIEKHKELGPHWTAIARACKGRSPNCVRNRWLMVMRRREKGLGMEALYPNLNKSKEEEQTETKPRVQDTSTLLLAEDSFDMIFNTDETDFFYSYA